MSFRLRREGDFLHTLMEDRLTARQRNQLLRRATRSQILALAEVAANVLAGHLEVETEARKALYPYRNALRRFARVNGRVDWRTRQLVMLKYAKALSVLLSVVAPSLERLLTESDASEEDEVQ